MGVTGLEPGWWCEGLGEADRVFYGGTVWTAIGIDALAEITFRGRLLLKLAMLALL